MIMIDTVEKIYREAKNKNLKISCAESCTGGLIGAALTEFPGISEIFNGSAVTYSNEAKINILGVKPETLKNFGAVSEQCAIEMAEGSRKIYDSDIAVSVTGIAGPDGGTELKPVGTVCFGISTEKNSYSFTKIFQGNRNDIRLQTVNNALEELLKVIKKNPPEILRDS